MLDLMEPESLIKRLGERVAVRKGGNRPYMGG